MSDFSYTDSEDYSEMTKDIKGIIIKQKPKEGKDFKNPLERGKSKKINSISDDLMEQFLELKEFEKNLSKKLPSKEKEKQKKPNDLKKECPEVNNRSFLSSFPSKNLQKEISRKVLEEETKLKHLQEEEETSKENLSDTSLSDEDSTDEESLGSESDSETSSGPSTQVPNLNGEEGTTVEGVLNEPKDFLTSDLEKDNAPRQNVKMSKKELEKIKELCRKVLKLPALNKNTLSETMDATNQDKSQENIPKDTEENTEEYSQNELQVFPKDTDSEMDNKIIENFVMTVLTEQNVRAEEEEKERLEVLMPKEDTKEEELRIEEGEIELNETEEELIILDLSKNGNNDTFENIDEATTVEEYVPNIEIQIEKDTADERQDPMDQVLLSTNEDREENLRNLSLNSSTKEEADWNEMYNLCNKCDDELIRQTILEIENIKEDNYKGEDTVTSRMEDESCQVEDLGDGDRLSDSNDLLNRIEEIQSQIQFLRQQLEEAKEHNKKEAMEISQLSKYIYANSAPIITTDGIEWEDWEIKELVRERLRDRREAAMLDYQTRLRVVDALCSAELGKLEDALDTLLPLNATASSWGPMCNTIPDMSTRSSLEMTKDYFFEVVTSMNLSSVEDKTDTGRLSIDELQQQSIEHQADSQ